MPDGFFDVYAKLNARPPRKDPEASGPDAAGTPRDEPLTVTQFNHEVARGLNRHFPGTIEVRGELSGARIHPGSGHLYGDLKDEQSLVPVVMFKARGKLLFEPEDGMEVLVRAQVKVYEPRGRYQLVADAIEPLGEGAFELAKRQLIEKLEREGLFDPARKRPLPAFPRRIAIVSGKSAAGFADILKVFEPYPFLKIYLLTAPMQGEHAAERITAAVRQLGQYARHLDVLLLARGGGAKEDLWPFNDEQMARAIADCPLPVVTGIGHEIDVSVADLAADVHCHTPTEAARRIVDNWQQVVQFLEYAPLRMRQGLRRLLGENRRRLEAAERSSLFRRPTDRLDRLRQKLDDRENQLTLALVRQAKRFEARLSTAAGRLERGHPRNAIALRRQKLSMLAGPLDRAAAGTLARRRQQLDALDRQLRAMSHESVLARGFSITRIRQGQIVRSAKQLKGGERLVTRLADGEVESTAQDPKQPPLF
ncbi:MAG: exodeoxyribonuclease VII large subunit [Phycisphaerae bacterium]